jgi:hypothetical protein
MQCIAGFSRIVGIIDCTQIQIIAPPRLMMMSIRHVFEQMIHEP